MKNPILGALLMGVASGAMAADLTVISFGGTSKDVQTEAFYKPFEK